MTSRTLAMRILHVVAVVLAGAMVVVTFIGVRNMIVSAF